MSLQMVLRFHSPVFLRGPPAHVVVSRSVFLKAQPAHVGSETYIRSCGGSHKLPWCSLAGDAQYLVLSHATRSVLDQTHSRAHRSAHLSTRYSFLLPRGLGAVFPPRVVAERGRYPHDHDRLWLSGQIGHSPGTRSVVQESRCHHCIWYAFAGQWQHQEPAPSEESMLPKSSPSRAFSSPLDGYRTEHVTIGYEACKQAWMSAMA